ncbi:hypothetical protein [Ruegeria sp.]|uniref:hypothetical protein n=1 Tax=Ruegeria sp. TaxID=1879320 RepID=UPI002312E129|nr:hypothetical protein [Ruegeria sp.]MDA7965624.1 hypothetical protein [Ruegeria sp.]
MQWEDITVVELETKRTHCDCCQQVTTHGAGDLLWDEDFIGWFTVNFSENSASHSPIIKVYVGDWSDGAPADSRWGVVVSWHSEGCSLLDWDAEDREGNDLFTCLNRDDVLGSEFAEELWAMVDAVITKDSRLKELQLS